MSCIAKTERSIDVPPIIVVRVVVAIVSPPPPSWSMFTSIACNGIVVNSLSSALDETVKTADLPALNGTCVAER
jgi:hypothetical protein